MAVENFDKKLDAVLSKEKSNWKDKAEWRLKNKSWLKHSRKIAIRLNSILHERGMTKKQLAELMNVSPPQVTKIMKGRENLTLETIDKLERALGVNLIFQENKSKEKTVIIKVSYNDFPVVLSQSHNSIYKGKSIISKANNNLTAVCIN